MAITQPVPPRAALALLACACAAFAAGCGEKEVTVTGAVPAAAAPAEVPRGWRAHENVRAGFTFALPRSWSARSAGERTRVRSGDGAVVASVEADRSPESRSLRAPRYALITFLALPGYRDLAGNPAPAPESPYPAAAYAGAGVREAGGRRQRVSVSAFQPSEGLTLAAVAFSDPGARGERETLERALTTLRVAPPVP